MLLKGKCAIITGSNRGIGKSILELFVENGADVFAHARKYNEEFSALCNKLSGEYCVKVIPVYFNFTEEEQVKRGVQEIKKYKRKIDILVNNAGVVNSVQLFQMTSMAQIRESFDINFFSPILLTQYISRMMITNKSGSVINIVSCAALDGDTGMLEYASSKAAMVGATKRLAIELGNYNIRVNAVAPGLTETDMGKQMSVELQEETVNRTIMKRKARPEEIANMVLFLASDMASYITGKVYRVDGGMLN